MSSRNTPNPPDPEMVAGGLSEAQRERLLAPDNSSIPAGIAVKFIELDFIEADPADADGWIWSPKAQAVRQILLTPKDKQ